MQFRYADQAVLELLDSRDLPALASQNAGITGVSHCTRLTIIFLFFLLELLLNDNSEFNVKLSSYYILIFFLFAFLPTLASTDTSISLQENTGPESQGEKNSDNFLSSILPMW